MTLERTATERAARRYAEDALGFEDVQVTGYLADPYITNVALVLVADAEEEVALLMRGARVLAEHDAEDFFRNGGRRTDGSYTNGTRCFGGKVVWGMR